MSLQSTPLNLCRRCRRGRRDAFHAVIDRKTDGRTATRMERERARGKSQEKQEEARLISLHIRDAGTGELQLNGGGGECGSLEGNKLHF